jgi:hypothetical protein
MEAPEMKLYRFLIFSETLRILFEFFEKNNIHSALGSPGRLNAAAGGPQGLGRLLDEILDSDYLTYSFCPSINSFTIDFDYAFELESPEIYYFIFGGDDSEPANSVLIDIAGRGKLSFMQISIESDVYPPFVKDFLSFNGEVRTSCEGDGCVLVPVRDSEIMGMDDFRELLGRNAEGRDVTWVVVE